jgi:hypothetical protein
MVFAPRWLLEKLLGSMEEGRNCLVSEMRARNDEIIEAKNVEIRFLMEKVRALEKAAAYERERADQLVDRLLVKDAKVAPIASMSQAAVQSASELDRKKMEEMEGVFNSINDVGEDEGGAEPAKTMFTHGGSIVRGGHVPTAENSRN